MTLDRREFLKRMGLLSMAGTQPIALNLATMSQAVAFNAGDDYKALVCVFLLGGNDHANTLIPIDTNNYAIYREHRGKVALDKSQILALTPSSSDPTVSYGLHPKLTRLHRLFHDKKVAILQNVGSLVTPTTVEQFKKGLVQLPPKIFSHNDQQAYWQTSGQEGHTEGWGAKMGRLAMGQNQRSLFTCVNTSGKMAFLDGNHISQYSLSADGIVPMYGMDSNSWLFGTPNMKDITRQMMNAPSDHLMEQQISQTFNQADYAVNILGQAIKGSGEFATPFADDELSKRLNIVAKMIKAHSQVGVKRQVFMVTLGGFDTHDNLLPRHDKLMQQLDKALASFYYAMDEIGMSNQVTAFTASEFGRTLTNNGDGTDHGWGSHHFIIGGAVKGQAIYGKTPIYGVDTIDDVGQGRLLPSTSIDQYNATLARWFGVEDSEIASIAPNIHNFNQRYLDFL